MDLPKAATKIVETARMIRELERERSDIDRKIESYVRDKKKAEVSLAACVGASVSLRVFSAGDSSVVVRYVPGDDDAGTKSRVWIEVVQTEHGSRP